MSEKPREWAVERVRVRVKENMGATLAESHGVLSAYDALAAENAELRELGDRAASAGEKFKEGNKWRDDLIKSLELTEEHLGAKLAAAEAEIRRRKAKGHVFVNAYIYDELHAIATKLAGALERLKPLTVMLSHQTFREGKNGPLMSELLPTPQGKIISEALGQWGEYEKQNKKGET